MSDRELELKTFLADLEDRVRTELGSKPDVDTNWSGDVDVQGLPIEARRWVEIPDLVAVVADMKNSTKMSTGKHAASTASIYQAATGGVVSVLNQFEADFIQIQGDGAFGLFWRADRYERAICAAITIQSFGGQLTDRLEAKWPDAPKSGIKVGVASSRVLVKRIGTPRNPAQQEPVWAGKAVNYAAKAAQGAERHEIVVTGTVWDAIEKNDFLTASCGCPGGEAVQLWEDAEIDRLPDDEPDASGRVLRTSWCATHGEEYCNHILAGDTIRVEAASERAKALASQRENSLREVSRRQREMRLAHRRGLR